MPEATALQPANLSGAIDKATGFILPVLDRFIEIKSIKESDGRDLTPRSVTGFADDPNAEQFAAIEAASKRQRQPLSFRNFPISLGSMLTIGGIILGTVLVLKVVKK
jgi:hypothetical protein